MNGRDILLILAHLFRKWGDRVPIDDAVRFLSFCCRYGKPSDIRRMLTLAVDSGMVSRIESDVVAQFLYNEQHLPMNFMIGMAGRVKVREDVEPLR